MDRSERIALGALVLVIAGFAAFIAAMHGEWAREAQFHAELAYAQDNLGGAGYAAIAKGGDPDAGGTEEARAGESGNEGNPVSQAAEEAAAQRAFPAEEVTPAQTAAAQRAFAQIKIRGNRGGKKGALLWNSLGPAVALQPGVLNFTGADYVTSGRAQALVVDRKCNQGQCRVWMAAAGGGVWTTKHGLHTNNPGWEFSSAGLGSNAFGTLVQDPTDSSGDTLYAGTGEPNASGDSEAGVGIYKSTNGGDSWSLVGNTDELFRTRAVASIAIDPTNGNVMYAAIARAVRGISSVSGGGASRTGAPQPTLGIYKTTNGGATWSLVWDAGTIGATPDAGRGASRVAIDPLDHTTVYASAYQLGIYRSKAGGAFQQVFAPQAPAVNTDRTMFALTTKAGKVRIYATNGSQGAPNFPYAAFYRVDDASQLVDGSANAGLWKKLTSNVNGDPFYATFDFCTGQCWYDQDVATPPGEPDTVYVLGSYTYGELGLRSNARGVVRSTTAGEPDPAANNRTFTDVTVDAAGNTIHPDQHEIAFAPGNPGIWWEASDGGIVRSSGDYTDISSQCDSRPLGAASMTTCHRLLSSVPTRTYSLNEGLTTLQFQSLSVNPQNPTGEIMGGTQDNGTWLYSGNSNKWVQTIYGDGGQSGFDVANPAIRFNQFFGGFGDVNFRSGDPTAWVIATANPLISKEAVAFYWPEIADPKVGGTIFTGFQHVWRTKDNGGNQFVLEANCPEFTTPGDKPGCGDFEALGGPAGAGNAGDLTATSLGNRAGGNVAAIERTTADTGTMWAATSTGRVFVSKNGDADPATAVTFTRIDVQGTNSLPNRFPSGIAVDPKNANHAWISYSGYNTTAGSVTPGHVFEVTFTPSGSGGAATWSDRSYDLGDLPLTDVALDDVTGDVYVSNDFGVLRLEKGTTSWSTAGEGLPIVEVPGLTIAPGARRLYAATHGKSAWYMNLT